MEISINPKYDKQVPKLSEQEYNSLSQSIKEYGQLSPILVNQDGTVLDGHHRFRICQELGIEPQYKVILFKDKVDERLFVSRSNLEGKGRHLNKFRRTELALKSKPDLKKIARRNSKASLRQNNSTNTNNPGPTVRNLTLGRVNDEIARMAGVSHDTVSKVEKILKFLEEGEGEGEEDLEKLRSEEISINQAYNLILNQEWEREVYDAIEPFHPQIDKILEDWEKNGEELFQQLLELGSDSNNPSAQRKDLCNKFVEYRMKELYAKMIFSVFSKSLSTPPTKTKQVNPKDEMSKVLKSIEMMKKVVMEREENSSNNTAQPN